MESSMYCGVETNLRETPLPRRHSCPAFDRFWRESSLQDRVGPVADTVLTSTNLQTFEKGDTAKLRGQVHILTGENARLNTENARLNTKIRKLQRQRFHPATATTLESSLLMVKGNYGLKRLLTRYLKDILEKFSQRLITELFQDPSLLAKVEHAVTAKDVGTLEQLGARIKKELSKKPLAQDDLPEEFSDWTPINFDRNELTDLIEDFDTIRSFAEGWQESFQSDVMSDMLAHWGKVDETSGDSSTGWYVQQAMRLVSHGAYVGVNTSVVTVQFLFKGYVEILRFATALGILALVLDSEFVRIFVTLLPYLI